VNPPAAYDLSPIGTVALVGGLLALGPLLWVWLRPSSVAPGERTAARLKALTLVTLFLTFDLVLFGAFTRLSDSGLGCPDWPGCYGELSPFQAHSDISAAQAALPGGPVTHGKAWIEMLHRYLATGVGALITALMLLAWRMRHAGGLSPWWATATFVWVCAQGAFGALTVTLKLQPIIVTGHLLGAVLGVAMLTAQVRVLSPRLCMPGDAADTLDAAWAGAGLRRVGLAVLLQHGQRGGEAVLRLLQRLCRTVGQGLQRSAHAGLNAGAKQLRARRDHQQRALVERDSVMQLFDVLGPLLQAHRDFHQHFGALFGRRLGVFGCGQRRLEL